LSIPAARVARELSERLGDDAVTAHHGSMPRDQRLAAEQRLKHGKLKALVATASLELGIDIGNVNLVCHLGSPRSIAAFLQAQACQNFWHRLPVGSSHRLRNKGCASSETATSLKTTI
jgi:superfamily II DNA/RNA helicase